MAFGHNPKGENRALPVVCGHDTRVHGQSFHPCSDLASGPGEVSASYVTGCLGQSFPRKVHVGEQV